MAVRLTVKVSDSTYEMLTDLATRDETTMTDIIRRSVAVYKYVDEAARDGDKVVVRDKNNQETLIALPS